MIWPGTDCVFILTVPEKNLDKMLKHLKTFRMSLPQGIVVRRQLELFLLIEL